MTGNAQGRHAFHEARRQTTEAAVAERRIGLQQANAFKVDAQFGQRFTGDVQQPRLLRLS
jgi:hypothetical protein